MVLQQFATVCSKNQRNGFFKNHHNASLSFSLNLMFLRSHSFSFGEWRLSLITAHERILTHHISHRTTEGVDYDSSVLTKVIYQPWCAAYGYRVCLLGFLGVC